jgi:hypothetical protein
MRLTGSRRISVLQSRLRIDHAASGGPGRRSHSRHRRLRAEYVQHRAADRRVLLVREQAFCPYCYALIAISATSCDACCADLRDWRARSDTDRLVSALSHPLADVRRQAIIALGLRREKCAERPLVNCAMNHPADVIGGLEVINSLKLIGDAEAKLDGLSTLFQNHPAKSVREASIAVLMVWCNRNAYRAGDRNARRTRSRTAQHGQHNKHR